MEKIKQRGIVKKNTRQNKCKKIQKKPLNNPKEGKERGTEGGKKKEREREMREIENRSPDGKPKPGRVNNYSVCK